MKRYKNKKAILGLLLITTLMVVLLARKPWEQPSQEMLSLRQIEQQLLLPTPNKRIEQDLGKNSDWKGVSHSTKYILLYYDNADNVESVVRKLRSTGWLQVNESELESSKSHSFVNKNLRACISTRIEPLSSDSSPHNIFIKAASDDGCSLYFRDE